ncbi:MAG: hypothetical protein U0V72_01545 [Cytophagales bacterium]
MSVTEEKFLVRDVINYSNVSALAHRIRIVYPDFNTELFLEHLTENFSKLGFKERINYVTEQLNRQLPKDFLSALSILMKSLGNELNSDTDFSKADFVHLSIGLYIRENGIDYIQESLDALKELTKRFSSEFDVRVLIEKYEYQTLEFLKNCTQDSNVHVRRWASEGARPMLPWGQKLHKFVTDPSPILPILDLLKSDSSTYVTRSVANSLNDISKNHPEIVLTTINRWLHSEKSISYLVAKHALRTLVKKGNIEALQILGFSNTSEVHVDLQLEKEMVQLGSDVLIHVTVQNISEKTHKYEISYVVHFLRANNKHNQKVFKLKSESIQPNQIIQISKKVSFKQLSTRKIYIGIQKISVQINGVQYCEKTLEVV